MARKTTPWWKAEEGQVHKSVLEYVEAVESAQIDIFDRFVKLDALYDSSFNGSSQGSQAIVSENVIASNVDTVYAVIAASDVRARLQTDDGDWSTQRRATHLSYYAEGLSKLLDVDEQCRRAFKGGTLKGRGMVKVFIDEFDRIRVERTMIDDIIVDESEVRAGTPRQMHQRLIVDTETLKARFPDLEDEIERGTKGRSNGNGPRMWAEFRPLERDEVVCVESWYLPIGVEGKKGYQAGRHTITIQGCDLSDEEWVKPFFPFSTFVWSERESGWYGIGLAERIVGQQRVVNKTNWQIDAQLDQLARPTTYVGMADANLAVKSRGPLGTIAVIKGGPPVTVIPQAVSNESYQRLAAAKESAFEESGVSRMAAQSKKPAGLDSGVALREHRDQTTQRFAQQEKGFEKLKLDTIWLVLDCAKDLGALAPEIVRRSRHGPKKFSWAKVDMGEIKVQIVAASSLSRTPAGRTQMAMEAAQSGIISQDAARRLMMPNSPLDFQHEMSLYTAAVEDVERCIEEILDGETISPEPYQNLKLIVWRGQMSYLKSRADGAPEEILENLRQWIVQAAYVQGKAEAPVQDMAASAGPISETDSTMPSMPMDPSMANATAGAPMAPDPGGFTGAGMLPTNLLQ